MPTVITGRDCQATFGPGLPLVIIGERINPTGRKHLSLELQTGNFDILEKEAVKQKLAGAQVLDINVGAASVNENIMLPLAVKRASEATGLPLCIDSASEIAIASALKDYPYKALINSVTGEEKSLSSILPLAKRYNAAIIGLTIDDGGIPREASKRIKIAHKIVERAEILGIPREDIVIDCLSIAASADVASARVTLDVIRNITNDLNISTAVGISNISFGMPERARINISFLAMCVEAGLSAAILDPTDQDVMYAVLASDFLSGKDTYAERFLTYYRERRVVTSA